jgi:glomulin
MNAVEPSAAAIAEDPITPAASAAPYPGRLREALTALSEVTH